jgi:hypothetical protein
MKKLTDYEKQQVISALKGTNKFIKKESARNPKLRPPETQELLDDYISHKAKLLQMLADDTVATYQEIY